MNLDLRARLVRAAREQGVLHYSELERMLGLDMDNPDHRRRIGVYLGEVARFEVAENRPMLSSVVWHKDMSGPGTGFHKLAHDLGLASADEDEMEVAVRELKRTHEYWSKH